MKRTEPVWRRLGVVVCALLAVFACQGAGDETAAGGLQPLDTSEANLNAIRAAMATFMTASNQGDVGSLVELFSDDAIRLPPNAQPLISA